MLDGRFRGQVETWVSPLGMSVKRAGIPADVITAVGLVMSVACAVAVGVGALRARRAPPRPHGHPRHARRRRRQGLRHVQPARRLLRLGQRPRHRRPALRRRRLVPRVATDQSRYLPVLAFAVFATAVLSSYIRAKADALGFDANVGLIERAERFVILGFGLLFDRFLVASLVLLVVLNLTTAIQRFVEGVEPGVEAACPCRVRRRPPPSRAIGAVAGRRRVAGASGRGPRACTAPPRLLIGGRTRSLSRAAAAGPVGAGRSTALPVPRSSVPTSSVRSLAAATRLGRSAIPSSPPPATPRPCVAVDKRHDRRAQPPAGLRPRPGPATSSTRRCRPPSTATPATTTTRSG